MAIGLGKMMGFRFPENFNDPYTSRSVTEFWKRWHITLGNFIMNYLYIPLGGNRKGKGRMYFNLWLCFLLSGLWHGASWNFVLWGAFHGLFICTDKLFLKNTLKKIGTIPSVIITFFLVAMGWVLFRVDTAADASAFYQALFAFKGGLTVAGDAQFWCVFALAVVFSFSPTATPNRSRGPCSPSLWSCSSSPQVLCVFPISTPSFTLDSEP